MKQHTTASLGGPSSAVTKRSGNGRSIDLCVSPLPGAGDRENRRRNALPTDLADLRIRSGASPVVPVTREMVVRSNYLVVYAEDAYTVTILRVLHGAQQWPQI